MSYRTGFTELLHKKALSNSVFYDTASIFKLYMQYCVIYLYSMHSYAILISILIRHDKCRRSIEHFYARTSETPFDRAFLCVPRAEFIARREVLSERAGGGRRSVGADRHLIGASLPGCLHGSPGWPHYQHQRQNGRPCVLTSSSPSVCVLPVELAPLNTHR